MLSAIDKVKLLKLGMPINEESLQKINNSERLKKIENKICMLKKQLSEEDYKVIKSNECFLANVHIPYNMTELYAKRTILRERINELETEKESI